jgi:hypothetical protein
VIRT